MNSSPDIKTKPCLTQVDKLTMSDIPNYNDFFQISYFEQNLPNKSKQSSIKKAEKMVQKNPQEIFTGIMKHFDEIKNYGFILMDRDHTEIFFHNEDVIKYKGISKDFLKTCRSGNIITVSFRCIQYIGKYKLSRKAIDIRILDDRQKLLEKFGL